MNKKRHAAIIWMTILSLLFQPLVVFAEDGTASSSSTTDAPITEAVIPPDETTNPEPPPTDDTTSETEAAIEGEMSPTEEEVHAEALSQEVEQGTPYNPYLEAQKKKLTVAPDNQTGALVYSFPFDLPPGRLGMEPQLGLTYNSQDTVNNSIVGFGWSLNIPFIQRMNKKGIERMYTDNYFTSSLGGDLQPINLVDDQHGTYGGEVESGDFLTYEYRADNSWLVTDKRGTQYIFGEDTASRQDDADDLSRIYKWMLTQVQDVHGNTVNYVYTKETGQIYPSRINYTGHNNNDGIFDVVFTLAQRNDHMPFYNTGFLVDTQQIIDQVEVQVNDQWTIRYDLDYVTGDNRTRSMLGSITESRRDLQTLAVSSLPATEFTYQKGPRELSWEWDPSYIMPREINFIFGVNNYHRGVRGMDFNGDGYEDMVYSSDIRGDAVGGVSYNNTHSGFGGPGHVNFPVRFTVGSNGFDRGVRFADLDKDGRLDIMSTYYDWHTNPRYTNRTFFNRENGAQWEEIAGYAMPGERGFIHQGSGDHGIRLMDTNGDQLPDLMMSFAGSDPVVARNDGQSFTAFHHGYSGPGFIDNIANRNETGLRIADMNGDGLQDLLLGDSVQNPNDHGVHINHGDGNWVKEENMDVPVDTIGDSGTRIFDINGDGLPDLVRSWVPFHNRVAVTKINRGNQGWDSDRWIDVPLSFDGDTTLQRMMDVNADGFLDIVLSDYGNGSDGKVYLSNAVKPDMLSTITHSTGAQTAVRYKPSTHYKAAERELLNPNLPSIIYTAHTIATNDGLGNIATTTYQYAGGEFYYGGPYDRKFAGFAEVTKTDAEGNVTKTYAHQGNDTNDAEGEHADHKSKIGKVYREEVYDDGGNLYQKKIYTWQNHDLNPGADEWDTDRQYVYLSDAVTQTFDGNNTHKDTAESSTVDLTNGNMLTHINYGEVTAQNNGSFVDLGSDKQTTTYTYATPTANAVSDTIIGLPSQEVTTNHTGIKVREAQYLFDGQALGNVEKGNLTSEKRWISGNTYATTQKSYNQYGLPITDTDANGNVTTYTYDAASLYPATVTNALDQQVRSVFDYVNGKPSQVIDPNGYTLEYDYDAFGRVTTQRIPNPTCTAPDNCIGATLVEKTRYTYTDNAMPRVIQQTDYLNAATAVETYTYLNGYNKPIQERKQSETLNTFITKDYTYTLRNQLATESLPYESLGSSRTAATQNQALLSANTYDAVGRPLTRTNIVGTTNFSYDNWETTTTDPLGNIKVLTHDAFERLVFVDEYHGNEVYHTVYTYNANNNLTKITDALGNVRNFSYDGLGRRTHAEDLHAANDATFGIYTYTYDAQGNITAETTPNQDTIYYTYDALHRPVTEALNDPTNTQTEYVYDTCSNGVQKLCHTITSDVLSSYRYDANGNIISESRMVDGLTYDVAATTAFDRQGNIQAISYPDQTTVSYTYNLAGLLEEVSREGQQIITNINYNPLFQVAYITYGNGVETQSTYDADELYRLRQKRTYRFGQPDFQNITYTYDAVGNVTRMVDASNTNAAKTSDFTYDDLYRITQATITNTANNENYVRTYTYNAIGNITNKSDQGNYSYQGHLNNSYANPHTVTQVGNTQITYDRNGNLVDDTTQTYTWNYKNRLLSSQNINTQSTTLYGYDHDGKRIYKTSPAGTTIYPNKYLELRNGSVVQYVYAGNAAIATVENGDVFFNHTDHLSGSNVITNEDGNINQLLDYYPFGSVRLDQQETSHDEKKKFTGYELDDESGLYYANARYYQSDWGRFVGVDPVPFNTPEKLLSDPQALNLYAYARNNPLKYIDPDGAFYGQFGRDMAWGQRVIGGYLNGLATQASNRGGVLGHSSSFVAGSLADLANGVADMYDPDKSAGKRILALGLVSSEVMTGGGKKKAAQEGVEFVARHGDDVAKLATNKTLRNFAKKIARKVQKKTGLKMGPHARVRAADREISAEVIIDTVKNSKPFKYMQKGQEQIGYYNKQAGTFVGTLGKKVTTVIDNVKDSYINNLKSRK